MATDAPPSGPPGTYTGLLESGNYSDLVLKSEDQSFKVHKAIVCSQSKVLNAACTGGFKEAASKIIDIKGFAPEAVKSMINYMYTGLYACGGGQDQPNCVANDETPNGAEKSTSRTETTSGEEASGEVESTELASEDPTLFESLQPHVQVNAIADFYEIPALCPLVNNEIQRILNASSSLRGFSKAAAHANSVTGDKELHNIFNIATAEHIDSLVMAMEDVQLIDVANSVLRTMVIEKQEMKTAHGCQLQKMQAGLTMMKRDLEAKAREVDIQRSRVEDAERMAQAARDNVDEFRDLLGATRECRNAGCGAPFSCRMEISNGCRPFKYRLRCTKCRCKH